MENILDMVITTKEASEIYPVSDSTIRFWLKNGEFSEYEYKKSGNTLIFTKEAIERILTEKGMFEKTFILEKNPHLMRYFGGKNPSLEIWYENVKTLTIINGMPNKDLLIDAFEIIGTERKTRFEYLLIDDNTDEEDNWFFQKQKVWAVTLKYALRVVRTYLEANKISTAAFDLYLRSGFLKTPLSE